MRRATVLFALAAALSPAAAQDWPDWAMNPVSDGGLAAAECAHASGNLSMDRQLLVANARVSLAQQIKTRVVAVDHLYNQRVQKGRSADATSVFVRASAQITDQALQDSRVARFEVIRRTFGPDTVCAMVVMGPKETRTYFTELVKVAGAPEITPQLENELFDTFRARKVER